MVECWESIEDYAGWYEVSDQGRIRNVKKRANTVVGKILKERKDKDGYSRITLCMDGHKTTLFVHRLVAGAFIGPCPEGKEVNHKDGVKAHNRPDNLEYVTSDYNHLHASKNGLLRPSKGENNGMTKLTEEDVHDVRRRLPHETRTSIAKSKGVCIQTISNIAYGITWAHLQEEPA